LAGSLGEIARSPLGWGLDFEYSGFEEDSSIEELTVRCGSCI
jgi:hypothetical protein